MSDERKDGRSNNGKNLNTVTADIGLTTAKPDQGLGAVAADMDLAELSEKFPGARFVSVKRFTAERKWESLGSVPLDVLDDDYMMNEFGPGLYTLYPRDEMGKMIGSSHLIRIGERATRGRPLAAAGGGMEPPLGHPIKIISPAAVSNEQLELLKSELQRRDEMIYRMLEALAQRTAPPAQAPPITILDMLTAFEKFQKLGQAAPVPFPEKLMERAFSMATKSNGSSGGNEWYELIKDIWHEVKEPLMQLAAPVAAAVLPPTVPAPTVARDSTGAAGITAPPPAQNPQPAPPVEVPAGDVPDDELETVNIDLDPWISDLKAQCKAGRPAELVAGAIRAQCVASEDIAAITEEIVTGEFEDFIKLDPELAGPAMKAWFKKLFEVVRVQLLGSQNDPAGSSRNGTNT